MNLPLVGVVNVTPVPAGAPSATLLGADNPDEMKPVIDLLTQTRKSLTLRSLFMTGFPYDPEFFAAGLALARQWSRQGLKVAVVDLDFRNPTLLRPKPDPNEGYVDALEYGCSFQRIAWELVNDALWLVGPGSHPPEERRFTEHPDWARVMRIFSGRVDVTLYLAPFLDKKGFSGALSKRMDGVLIATSVRRSSRAALRDAFLELWGSDAPMIGYLGLDVPYVLAPRGEVELSPAEPWSSARFESSKSAWPYPAPPSGGAAAGPQGPPAPTAPASAPKPSGSRRATDPKPEPPPGITRAHVTVPAQRPTQALVERISDEVRREHVPRSAQPRATPGRSYGILWGALLLITLAGAGAWFAYQAMRSDARRAAPRETLPSGTEPMLPENLGAQNPSAPGGSEPAQTPSVGIVSGAPLGGGSPSAGTDAAGPGISQETRGAAGQEILPYRVHVASFRSEKTVRELVRRLRLKGLDAWYAKATDQPDWYRVFVGHYAARQEAAQKAAELLNHGWVDHAMAYPDNAR
ncbi:MAG TPA: SPOR domain-containing protein [Candidatus Dormibacteraeota bacterium]|nr:SPOR domain-containing protein [Candidatus Dormibacteraeota bacterium]